MAHSKLKNIAEGYYEDATSLLEEFADLKTAEFKEFSSLWKKHHFSLIFMGHPDQTEASEFINEAYTITSGFLFMSSFYQQVGAVYILYGLYLIQNLDIKIRLEMDHWQVIQSLRSEAKLKNYLTLQFVIDYLIRHAFLYVASQTLKGPLIRKSIPKTKNDDDDKAFIKIKEASKSGILKYNATNSLAMYADCRKQYVDMWKKIGLESTNLDGDPPKSLEIVFRELNKVVNFDEEKKESLGDRRAKLKAQSFKRKSKNHIRMVSKYETDDIDDGILNKTSIQFKKQKRTPKGERKVGRPRKIPLKNVPEENSDDEVDFSHLIGQLDMCNLLNDKTKKIRTKRGPYYQDLPKQKCGTDDESPDYF